jgi:hypothetical protein
MEMPPLVPLRLLPTWVQPTEAARVPEVTVNQATFVKQGQPTPAPLAKDRFGPGIEGIGLCYGEPVGLRDEVRYVCQGIPEGEHTVGLRQRGRKTACPAPTPPRSHRRRGARSHAFVLGRCRPLCVVWRRR